MMIFHGGIVYDIRPSICCSWLY